MDLWINFWTLFFFMSLALFACLAVVVTIGGFFNIRSLLRDLKAGQKDESLRDRDMETEEI